MGFDCQQQQESEQVGTQLEQSLTLLQQWLEQHNLNEQQLGPKHEWPR